MPKYTEQQLQNAVKHARREPDVPIQRMAELHGVERQKLRRSLLGTHQERSKTHRNEQLFSVGDERAIASYAGIMADANFPLSPELLRQIAQAIVNERQIPQQGHPPASSNPSSSASNLGLFTMDPASSTSNPLDLPPPIHTIGIHWVDSFPESNLGFKKIYSCSQERALAAAMNDM